MTGNLLVFLGVALASAVEMVEALTIVLALAWSLLFARLLRRTPTVVIA